MRARSVHSSSTSLARAHHVVAANGLATPSAAVYAEIGLERVRRRRLSLGRFGFLDLVDALNRQTGRQRCKSRQPLLSDAGLNVSPLWTC